MMVVLFHYRDYLNNQYSIKDLGDRLFSQGYFGVDLFFLISGFIMVYSTRHDEESRALKFFIRRFFRVVPLAWLATVMLFCLTSASPDYNVMKLSLMFIPLKEGGPPFYGYSFLQVIWTLSYELAFYALFLVSIALSHRWRSTIATLLIFACVVVLQKALTGSYTFDAHDVGDISAALGNFVPAQVIGLIINPLMVEFIIGVWIAEIYICFGKSLKLIPPAVIALLCTALLAEFLLYYFGDVLGGHGPTNKGLGAIALFIACLLAEAHWKVVSNRFLSLLLYFGTISYSIYLFHSIFLLDKIIPRFGGFLHLDPYLYLPRNGAIVLLTQIAIVILISHLAYHFFEKPLQRIAKKLAYSLP